MRTAIIHDYQSDFDNSEMVNSPDNTQVLKILLTHPMPYKVEFKTNDTSEGQIYYQTDNEAKLAKTEWETNAVMTPSGIPGE